MSSIQRSYVILMTDLPPAAANPPATVAPTPFAEQAAAALALPYEPVSASPLRPVTFDEIMSERYGMVRPRLAIPTAPDQMDTLNEQFAIVAPTYLTDYPPDRAEQRRVLAIKDALVATSQHLQDSGYVPPPSLTPRAGVVQWPHGYSVVTMAREVELALPQLIRDAGIGRMDRDDFKSFIGADGSNLGWLFTEDDVATLLGLDASTLRNWRTQRKHLEYVKGPGARGFILYTQRGLEAFVDKHLAAVSV